MTNTYRKQTLALLKQAENLLKKNEHKELADEVKEAMQIISKETCSVIVCGEFKRGKSSLINALLGQQGFCPVDIDIATSVVSIIRYGDSPKVIRHFGQVGGNESETVNFEALSLYATGDKNNDTWFLDIEVPYEPLKSGLVFIDTPGVGGLDPRHSFLTSYFIPRAEIALFVVDASEPVSKTELEFIHDKIAGQANALVIALNKTDNAEDIDAVIKDVREKIEDTIGHNGIDTTIIPVSSRLKLEYLETGDREDLEESNFSSLENTIHQAVSVSTKATCKSAVQHAAELIDSVLAPLAVQSSEFKKKGNEDFNDLQNRCIEHKKKMEAFCGPAAEWRVRLSEDLSQLKLDVGFELKEGAISLGNKILQNILDQEGWEAQVSSVATKLENEINSLVTRIDKKIINKTEAICKELGNELDTRDSGLTKGHFSFSFDRSVQVDGPNVLKMIAPTIKNGFFGASVMVTLGGPLGAIGGGLLLMDGVKNSVETAKNMHKREISMALSEDIQKSSLALQKYFDERIKEADKVMQKAVQDEAERRQTRYTEVAEALKAVIKQSVEERKAHENLLKQKIRPMEQMLKYFDRLEKQLG